MNAIVIQQSNRSDLEQAFLELGSQEFAHGFGGNTVIFTHPQSRKWVYKFADCCLVEEAPKDQLPPDVVSMTSTAPCKPADDPYLNFLAAIKYHQNRYLPKIKSAGIYQGESLNYYHVTGIERLYPYEDYSKKIQEQFHPDRITDAIDSGKWIDEDFEQVASLIRPLLNRFSLDIHEGNLMFRGRNNPQLVLIDPIC